MSDPPDIVYVVRRGEDNEELRYSLRSIVNVPHRRVFIAGYMPSWVRGVTGIAVPSMLSKWASSTANLYAACHVDEVSDEFIYFNDDMFMMHPLSRIDVYHRGPVNGVIRDYHSRLRYAGRYVNGMERTRILLEQRGLLPDEILSYELHVPMPVRKTGMISAIDIGRHLNVLHKRTVYGNLARLGGERVEDVKVCAAQPFWSPEWSMLSTDDQSFRSQPVGVHIRDTFTEPGPYEATGVRAVAL